MNYYEHHIGDYAEATLHLTFAEDAAYSRLIRKYYAQEKPIPADLKAAQRLVGARTKEEKKAVETVLSEFFFLEADGFHNTRCDEELAKFLDKQNKARASANSRWNKTNTDSERNANASANAMRTHSEGNAHQPPDTSNQTPDTSKPPTVPDDSPTPSAVGALCIAMRAAGVQAQPHDPRMMALAKQGVTPETLTAACLEAKKSKPLDRITPGYVLGILLRWSKEAEQLNVAGAAQPASKKPSIAEQLEARKNRGTDPDLIDLN